MATSPLTPLSRLRPGQKGHIIALESKDARIIHKLLAMGILPGMAIKVVQRTPTWVVQIGYTQVALDSQIAGVIRVHVAP